MGKKKYIEKPEMLFELFQLYREWAKANPITKEDYVGKDAKRVQREYVRPLTMEGFENWVADQEIIKDLGDYFENRGNSYSDYSAICSRIKKIIRQDQIEGGLTGIYNPSITQRLNGLADKKEIEKTETYITPEDRERRIKELMNKLDKK